MNAPCRKYLERPQRCGNFDDDDFTASAACCGCDGGQLDCAPTRSVFADMFVLLYASGPPLGAVPCEWPGFSCVGDGLEIAIDEPLWPRLGLAARKGDCEEET